jgi:hypothetical protein
MPRNRALDLLKWLAMLCMVLDHLRYVGWSLDVLYIPGRLAFPWFCLAIAANLTRRPDAPLGGRYLGWLVIFAAVSEIPYRMFVYPAETLNVLPTLALGLIVAKAWQQRRQPSMAVLGCAALVIAAVFAQHLMFGLPGVLLPLGFVLAWHRPLYWALPLGVLCLAGNAWVNLFESVRHVYWPAIGGIVACLLAPGLGLVLLRAGIQQAVVPMRRWAYAIYPVHFLVLLGLRLLLRAV